ncbi:MAG: glutamate--cysteine ligase [Paraglaciecola sp.]|uniref:glutamate--cysteine ligase n=1 Tax=Paraglaciecola sp. TaxID=1920173 RepID=UPI00273FCD33|nr:glutamate--cysteine ligase [Paraglaciecola sp.]MDP5032659.1 glutamate--cysteine ligase [Paraglaciecola sp.]MDP5132446.1 glutamate--cysteine ligase [Paraglaciecola sp.]
MQTHSTTFAQRLALLQQDAIKATLPDIKHGVERETLRVNPNGGLAQTPHAKSLGSALTHDFITTDFSESLLEFITPPETSADLTIAQLQDVHKYTLSKIGQEMLWPMSMPCFITSEDEIPLAQYGTSNIGKMKTLYRQGLKNRYGSMMQAISGVHFNFSLPDSFWQEWIPKCSGEVANKDTISAAYFALIRNYRRFCWLLPYLYGASPALCSSFIKNKATTLPFNTLGKGTYYLPYATSLRMSDLGYTNSAQSGLAVCYNDVSTYIKSLRCAINKPSATYEKFASKKDGQYQQLNANVLQIENELYSPIRPKQPTKRLEKPTDALDARGVNYVEVRVLDVNPFSDIGIERNQFFFLDVFLVYCAISPSDFMQTEQYQETEKNLKAVVKEGRDPQLRLLNKGEPTSIPQWAESLFSEMKEVAILLDNVNNTTDYTQAVALEWEKVLHPELTPSAKILDMLLSNSQDNSELGLKFANSYKASLLAKEYQTLSETELREQATLSLSKQQEIEASDTESFDEFLVNYFSSDQKVLAEC